MIRLWSYSITLLCSLHFLFKTVVLESIVGWFSFLPLLFIVQCQKQVKGQLWNSHGLRKENIFQCLLKTKGLWDAEQWIWSQTARLFVVVIGYRALLLPRSVKCTLGNVLHVTFNSHLIANKWKRTNTIRCNDLLLRHRFFV